MATRRRSPAPASGQQAVQPQLPVTSSSLITPQLSVHRTYGMIVIPVIAVALAALSIGWPTLPGLYGLEYSTFARWIVSLGALAGFWWFWAALRVSALRAQLLLLFPENLAPASWVDLSKVDFSAFGRPKGVDTDQPLLWTSQAESLWCELIIAPRGNVFRGQILAGPSGIGKTHLALLLSLRCYALGIPVLYVPDAGELLEKCSSFSWSLAVRWFLDASLLSSFAIRNLDVTPSALVNFIFAAAFPLSVSVQRLLHSCDAVIIIDEHGHAYNAVKQMFPRLRPAAVFPLLMPNCYLDSLRVRCVFAGSNQAHFEGELNGTYSGCIRFVVPFESGDAVPFLSRLLHLTPTPEVLASYERWSNFVPREMILLSLEDYPRTYVAKRRGVISESLGRMADSLGVGTTKQADMVRVLDNFFGKSSMAMGIEAYSFLDFGFVYRRGYAGVPVTAHPLCYPATLALMDLWRNVSRAASPRLVEVIRDRDGLGLEDLVWDVLLARGFRGDAILPCYRLGEENVVQQLVFNLTDYYVSQLIYHNTQQNSVNAELATLMKRSQQLAMSLLYRCPIGSADVDFFVLHPNGKCDAIQVSLSTLTQHCRGGTIALISGIAVRYGIPAANLRHYIFITPQREAHPRVAAQLAFVRVVDAAMWIGL